MLMLSPDPFLTSLGKSTQIFIDMLDSFSQSSTKRTIISLRDALSVLCHFVTWEREYLA